MSIVSDEIQRGIPRIEGREITVLDIYEMVVEEDRQPADVAETYELDLSDVYEALAFYYGHPDEMHDARRTRKRMIEDLRERVLDPEDVASPALDSQE